MRASKLWKTLTVSAMSLALMASVTAMPAMAASVTTDGTGAGLTSFTITKNLTKEANTMVPNTTFNFEVKAATAGVNETRSGIPVSNGIEGGITVASGAAFTPGEALNSQTSVTSTATFNVVGNSFTTPGIYKYTISEVDGDYDGITYSTNVLNLYVYVQNDGGKVIVKYTELVDPDGGTEGGEAKTDSFTNDYDSNGNQLHDLVLYKVVSGNAANMGEKFTFSVKIDGETGEKYYVECGKYESGTFTATEGETFILTSGTANTNIQLGNNEAIKIYGLDDNDSYTITEQNANTNGYSLKINDAADGDGVINGTINADTNVKYENTKSATTPTGIVMNIAPYALMVVIAVAGVAVFMRKRVEE